MAKTKKKKRAGVAAGGLKVDVKIGILHTIANAIYSTPAGKIREAVANARDNEATWIAIVVDRRNSSLFLFDNGSGITNNRFHKIFESIGYGLLRDNGEDKLSYFGLGLMSIFQLGKEIEIFTRATGKQGILKLKVNTEAIFSKGNEKESISKLRNFINVDKANERERAEASASVLNEFIAEKQDGGELESFTEIVIKGISKGDLDTICETGFGQELRKLLPLKAEEGEPFLKRFTGTKGKEVRKMMGNSTYCKTINVLFGFQEEESLKQLWKYFPAFRSDIEFPDDNVLVGRYEDDSFAYYFLHSVAVDLQRVQSEDSERETGFWVRNQNFLVKGADFLERPGPGRPVRTIHKPLQPWIFGEVFHRDMNRILTVSRNDYLFDEEDFKTFRNEVAEIVEPLNKKLRDIYTKKKRIEDGFVGPFIQFASPEGPLHKAGLKLREMIQGNDDEVLRRLNKMRDKTLEKLLRVDKVLERNKKPIMLGEDSGVLVRIDPRLRGKAVYDTEWDAKNERVVVSVSPDLFAPQDVLFCGKSFKVVYVTGEDSDLGVSIDVKGKMIYVNPFNAKLTEYSVRILDVYVVLKVAEAISGTKRELVDNALGLLGAKSEITHKYITPLGDDLRRTVARVGA